jgi:hypothetical protein
MIKAGYVWLAGLTLATACAANYPKPEKPALDITGTWEGITITDCGMVLLEQGRCMATERVTFTFFQEGSKVSGFYTCTPGTTVCRGMNVSGQIVSSTLEGSLARIRVTHPDGSSCIYNAHFRSQSAMGGFACYQGGGILEQGRWKVSRAY